MIILYFVEQISILVDALLCLGTKGVNERDKGAIPIIKNRWRKINETKMKMIIITRTRLTVVVSLVVLILSSFVSPVFGTASTTTTKSVPPPPPPLSAFVSDSNDNHGINNANTTAATAVVIPEWKRVLPYPLNNKTQSLRRILVPGPHTGSGSHGRGQHQDHVEVILLGTAHVSKDSCRDVQVLLETIKPTVVFIEMCTARIPMMLPSNTDTDNQNQNPTGVEEDIINKEDDDEDEESIMKEKEPFLDRLSSSLSFFCRKKYSHAQEDTDEHIQSRNHRRREQRPLSLQNTASKLLEKMQSGYADSLGVELGGEFRVAYQYWDEQQRQEVVHQSPRPPPLPPPLPSPPYLILGDRPVSLTLTRAWESLRVWGKVKLIVGLLLSSFQKPNPDELKEWIEQILSGGDDDIMSKSIEELAKHFPSLKRVIIEERDAYMACKVYQTCRHLLLLPSDDPTTTTTTTTKHHTMVVIVGAGHIEGMCNWLTKGHNNNNSNNDSNTVTASKFTDTVTTTSSNKTPEEIIESLIDIKRGLSDEDRNFLMNHIIEMNYDLLEQTDDGDIGEGN